MKQLTKSEVVKNLKDVDIIENLSTKQLLNAINKMHKKEREKMKEQIKNIKK